MSYTRGARYIQYSPGFPNEWGGICAESSRYRAASRAIYPSRIGFWPPSSQIGTGIVILPVFTGFSISPGVPDSPSGLVVIQLLVAKSFEGARCTKCYDRVANNSPHTPPPPPQPPRHPTHQIKNAQRKVVGNLRLRGLPAQRSNCFNLNAPHLLRKGEKSPRSILLAVRRVIQFPIKRLPFCIARSHVRKLEIAFRPT